MNNRLLKSVFTSLINYRLLTGIAVIGILTGCSSSGGTVADNNNNLTTAIMVEKSAIIPVLDGKATTAGVYIHNTTNKTISGISYALAQNNSPTSLTVNAASCNSIAANTSCLLPITTPAVTNGNSGNNILVASYNGQQSKQLINYRYVNTNDYNGVNFSDNSQTLFGINDYATVYVFAGKGQYYNNIGFNLNNTSLAISSGLTNGTITIPANSVIPLEIQSNQNVTSNLVTVTPYVQTTSKNLAKAVVSGLQNNSQLQVAITPTQQANLLMSDAPVLTNSESTTTLTIFNNGNQSASSLNLTSGSANITVTPAATNPCGSSLASGASCNYTVNKNNADSNGSAVLTLGYNNSISATSATQTVYYLNSNSEPMVSAVATQTNFSEQVATNQNITFNITNSGNAPLSSANITTKTTLAHTNLTIQNNTCTTTIAANGSCSLQINVAASGLIDSGVIYLNLSGTYVGVTTKSYSFMSKPVYTTIVDTSNPTVTSTTPQDTATSVSTATGIVVNFSESMTPTTLNNSNIKLQKLSDSSTVPLTLQGVSNNNQTVTFSQTSGKLADLTQYRIVINPSQIKDINGNAMNSTVTESVVATFTTGDTTAPTISSIAPANGSSDLSQSPTISLTFSEAMNQSTMTTSNIILQTQAGTVVAGTSISYDPTTYTATINLNGTSLSSQTTYQVVVNQQNLTDISGNPMGSNSSYLVSQFTIGDYTAPTLSSTVPVNGSTNVAVGSVISLTFSEAIDTTTLTTTSIKLQKASDSSNISLNSPTYSNNNQTVTFQPTTNLAAGESYNIVINPSIIKDVAGNAMGAATAQTVSNFSVKPAQLIPNFIGVQNGNLAQSTDGVNWSPLVNGSPIVFDYSYSISYIDNKWMFAGATSDCGGSNSYCTTAFSVYDGSTWSKSMIYDDGSYTNMFYPNGGIAQGVGKTVVNGEYYDDQFNNHIAIFGSANLSTWSHVYAPSNVGSGVTGIAFGNNAFVEVNYGGPSPVLRSTNGTTFSAVSISAIYASPYLHDVIYSGGKFVVVGGTSASTASGKPLILTSSDGLTWTNNSQTSLAAGSLLNNIAYGNGTYVAVGYYTDTSTGSITKGLILTSTDGTSWVQRNDENMSKVNLYRVAYGSGKWVAVGSDSTNNPSVIVNFTSSDNGVTWTKTSSTNVVDYVAGIGV